MSRKPRALIGLYNPKSPSNVGSVMRAAGCYGVAEVRYSGERLNRALKFQTDTKNIADQIPLTHAEELLAGVASSIEIVCVELVQGATPLPSYAHPERAMYVFGPEDGSLPQTLIDQADHVVYVPTVGCMNLAASVNVLLYDRLAKANLTIDHPSLLKRSRDVNNRLRVKKVDKNAAGKGTAG